MLRSARFGSPAALSSFKKAVLFLRSITKKVIRSSNIKQAFFSELTFCLTPLSLHFARPFPHVVPFTAFIPGNAY